MPDGYLKYIELKKGMELCLVRKSVMKIYMRRKTFIARAHTVQRHRGSNPCSSMCTPATSEKLSGWLQM